MLAFSLKFHLLTRIYDRNIGTGVDLEVILGGGQILNNTQFHITKENFFIKIYIFSKNQSKGGGVIEIYNIITIILCTISYII